MTDKKKLPKGFDYERFPNSSSWSPKEADVLQININALNQTMDIEEMDKLFESNCSWSLQAAQFESYNSSQKEKEDE